MLLIEHTTITNNRIKCYHTILLLLIEHAIITINGIKYYHTILMLLIEHRCILHLLRNLSKLYIVIEKSNSINYKKAVEV